MGTVFLTNPAAVAGKYERYDSLELLEYAFYDWSDRNTEFCHP